MSNLRAIELINGRLFIGEVSESNGNTNIKKALQIHIERQQNGQASVLLIEAYPTWLSDQKDVTINTNNVMTTFEILEDAKKMYQDQLEKNENPPSEIIMPTPEQTSAISLSDL